MTIFDRIRNHKGLVAILAVTLIVVLSADSCDSGKNGSQDQSQQTTEAYQQVAQSSVPYPLSQMKTGGWLERSLLRENLLRQNDKHRIAYVTLLNNVGQPIAQFTIQGMVFDLNSQMTTQDVINNCPNTGNSGQCGVITRAPGDNGTWGDEPHAIGFFTTSGAEVKWNGTYVESDTPLNLTTKPIITYDAGSKPSVSAGGIGAVASH